MDVLKLNGDDLNAGTDGSGYAVSQSIPANTLVDKGTTVTVQFQSQ